MPSLRHRTAFPSQQPLGPQTGKRPGAPESAEETGDALLAGFMGVSQSVMGRSMSSSVACA